jgi:hypothetical protein
VGRHVLPPIGRGGKTRLAVRQQQTRQVLTIEVEQVEDEVNEVRAALPFRRVLERGEAVRLHSAEFAVEISLPGRKRSIDEVPPPGRFCSLANLSTGYKSARKRRACISLVIALRPLAALW